MEPVNKTGKTKTPAVDIHTHLYPTFYIDLLKGRTEVPYVKAFPPSNEFRLTNRTAEFGKPIIPLLYDVSTKIAFMDTHNIDISVLSLGNPWLDFLPPEMAGEIAKHINDSTNSLCLTHPGRLFFFATPPLSASTSVILAEISRFKTLSHVRGIVLGTNGLGADLDDPNLLPVFQALAEAFFPILLHPHYGLPTSVYGPRNLEYGQVLPVALGFPMETTMALTRLILAGFFEAVPDLQIIAARSGGALPFLAGRIESCIEHDKHLSAQGKLVPTRKTVWDVMKKNIYLDGVIYDKMGMKTAIDASGVDRVMFGTDHPFFPPLVGGVEWPSMTMNLDAVKDTFGSGVEYDMVMGGNAARRLNLK